MTRAQQYIDILLDHIPKWELQNYVNREIYDKIKTILVTADDLREKLKELYKVRGFSDFALCLLWIVDKVDHNLSSDRPTKEEEELVFRYFRKAVGEDEVESTPEKSETISSRIPSGGTDENVFAVPDQSNIQDIWGWSNNQDIPTNSSESKEEEFAHLLEQFLESIQSGDENRFSMLENLRRHCQAMRVAEINPLAQDFYMYLHDFLEYVELNQLIDDIRVINLTANIQEPYTTWVKTPEQQRTGILEQSVEILRNFKEMFE
ncbi:MAG: hypothetical protein N3A63_05190 [Bacteroidetes bacterium]|nr:hypothetical protein [Bacteroidota bacterium]